ncbi:MAG: phytoene/squalene synthase family protein, partial [Rhizobiaceae bacterium]|nr:phytoene/squalene synthase family protein [Rhizobiaceae bacterium]
MMKRKFTSEHISECRRIIREGSKSFYFASLMLPAQVRMAATALYAFCRVTDDIADDGGATSESIAALRHRLDSAYNRTPYDHPADHAFSAVVQHFDIPKEIPAALIDGYEWDIEGKTCESLSDVIAYSARVAGTVGLMMSIVMGRRIETTLARACDLGVAMQLINIARDVGEDARNGRIYLPREWMREAGMAPDEFLRNPEFTGELGSVVQRLLDVADG